MQLTTVAQKYQQVSKDLDAPQSPLLPDSPASAFSETGHESPKATVFYLLRSPRLPVALITILVIAFVIPAFDAVCSILPITYVVERERERLKDPVYTTDPSLIRH